MSKKLHCVIGGAGDSAQAVVRALRKRNEAVVSVARTKGAPGVLFRSGDILHPESLQSAMQDATHIYLCHGFPYNTKIWEEHWPIAANNVIAAATKTGARILFLDNIYMYGPAPLLQPITEEHPQQPVSRKGKIRKAVADQFLNAHKAGEIQLLIARAPDFYGPFVKNSIVNVLVQDAIQKKRPIYWPARLNHAHSFVYIEDLGEAIADLALAEDSWGQIWHLPVSANPPAMFSMLEMVRDAAGSTQPVKPMPGWLEFFLKAFLADFRQSHEMLYQYAAAYLFDSGKFQRRFPRFAVTSYQEGIEKTGQAMQQLLQAFPSDVT